MDNQNKLVHKDLVISFPNFRFEKHGLYDAYQNTHRIFFFLISFFLNEFFLIITTTPPPFDIEVSTFENKIMGHIMQFDVFQLLSPITSGIITS